MCPGHEAGTQRNRLVFTPPSTAGGAHPIASPSSSGIPSTACSVAAAGLSRFDRHGDTSSAYSPRAAPDEPRQQSVRGCAFVKKQHLVKREEYRLQGCDARAWGNLPLPASVRRSGSRPRGSPLCGLVGHDEPGATRSLTTGRCTSRQVDRCDLRHLGGVCALGSEKTLGHWVRPSSGAALSCRCTGRPCVVWTHPNLVGRASCALHSRHRFRSHRGHSALKSKSGHSTVMNQFSGLAPPPAAAPFTAPRPPRR